MDDKPTKATLDLADIDTGPDLQCRSVIRQDVVEEYAEHTADLPPVCVFHDGRRYYLADGFHRYAAHTEAGKTQIKALVYAGTKREALVFAAGANAHHGLRRTAEDKRRAAAILLNDGQWRKRSDATIAAHCHISDKTVADVRAELYPETATEPRIGRDGKTRQLPIQKQPRKSEVDPSPPETEPAPPEPPQQPRKSEVDAPAPPTCPRGGDHQYDGEACHKCHEPAPPTPTTQARPAPANTPRSDNQEPAPADCTCPTCGGTGRVPIVGTIPVLLDNDEFRQAWAEWLVYRRQKRQKLTAVGARRQLKALADLGAPKAIASITQSITHGWTGLFPPDQRTRNANGRQHKGQLYEPDAKHALGEF